MLRCYKKLGEGSGILFFAAHLRQWRRSVVKYGGQGQLGQAIKLFQAPRKISFTFHF